jgi:hypothetical protein
MRRVFMKSKIPNILPDHHDIPHSLYDRHHGDFVYKDENLVERCKICGAEVDGGGDMYGGMEFCTESGTMLFDW